MLRGGPGRTSSRRCVHASSCLSMTGTVEPNTEQPVPHEEARPRRFPRVPFHVPVRLTRLATGQVLDLQAQNLSESGLFVETVIPFPVGELFRLRFPTSPGDLEEVAVARVVWRRAYTPSRPAGTRPGLGIAFLLMRPAERRALGILVEEGGVAPPEPERQPPPRAPDPPPPETSASPLLAAGPLADEIVDLGPTGWLLLAALSMAAVAALLAGLQPLP